MKKSDPDSIMPGLSKKPGSHLAAILVHEKVLSLAKIEKAGRVQEKLGNSKLLSTILIELNMLTESDHRRLLHKHGHKFRIGDLFCELGYITLKQLIEAEKALANSPGKRMGEVVRDLSMIDDKQLAQALSEQLKLPLIHLDIENVDCELIGKFPIKLLIRHRVIPLEVNKNIVSIATSDPLNNAAITEIENRLDKKAKISITTEGPLLSILNKLATSDMHADESKDQVSDVVDSILLAAIRDGASDIHIEPMPDHIRIRYRLDGVLIHKMDLPNELAHRVTARIKVLAKMDISDSRRHQDGRFTREVGNTPADYRVSTYVTLFGENMVLRILQSKGGLKSIDNIHMSSGLLDRFKHEALDSPTGVILITGPTGSGKTTTLYAAIDYLNRQTTKIITVEDPVEYIVPGIMQCTVSKQAGRSFEDSLKAVVRQDPDIIVIGEIRDKQTAQVAVQAALTGHKVITTFHTEDSIGGLLRLIDMGVETFLISSTVVSVLAQRLIRTICPECRQTYIPNKRIANLIGIDDNTLRSHTFYRGTGCGACYGTGYHGRTALHELLVLNEDVREAILECKTSQEIRQISYESTNLLSLMENGLFKVLQGYTTVEEVYRIVPRTVHTRTVEKIYEMMGYED